MHWNFGLCQKNPQALKINYLRINFVTPERLELSTH